MVYFKYLIERAQKNFPDIVVEVKNRGEVRFVREGVNQLLRYLGFMPNASGLIIAPYISQKSAAVCKEAGIGYIDLSGNCFISFKNIHIEKEGKANKQLEKRLLKSLYYPKAERLLRVILNNPGHVWKVQDLSKEAGVSLGMVSNVKQQLEAMEWITASKTGFTLRAWDELLKDWQTQYSYTKNKQYDFYSLKSTEELEKEISEYGKKSNTKYALTMFSGAARLAPYTRYNRVYAYVDSDVEKLATDLKLKPVSSGPNVTLLSPYDEGVFYGAETVAGVKVVSPIQLYLDLMSNKGRGEEAAEFLRKEVIESQWSQKKIMENGK